MARLTNYQKAGYYPFPAEHLPAVVALFSAPHGGKILDPCAGAGQALGYLAEALHLTPYANELDQERATLCAEQFGAAQVIEGDLFRLRASSSAFNLLWVNPLYGEDVAGDEKRNEFAVLQHSWKWAQVDGYVVWIVYRHHLTPKAAAWIARHAHSAEVYALPGLHLGAYTTILVVMRVGVATHENALYEQLRQAADHPPLLEALTTPRYILPKPRTVNRFIFTSDTLTPDTALRVVQAEGVQHSLAFQQLIAPPPPVKQVLHPIVKPRGPQLAMVLAAGMMNGCVLEHADWGRCAVRGTLQMVEEKARDDLEYRNGNPADQRPENIVHKEILKIKPVTTVTLTNQQGEVLSMSGDQALIDFIQQHQRALLAYLERELTPIYDFQLGELAPLLQRIRIKGHALLPTQQHVVAALHRTLQQRKGVYLIGEMGIGKTICASSLILSLQSQMKPAQVALVVCPPLVEDKWPAEIHAADPHAFVKVLRTVDEVRAFMDQSAKLPNSTLKVGVIPESMAKLGEGREVGVFWRKRHVARWAYGTARPEAFPETTPRIQTLEEALCPTCARPITYTYKGQEQPATKAWLNSGKRQCSHCCSALWQDARTFSAPKSGEKYPSRNPRVPLAEYIAQVFPKRVYITICDELHQLKDAGTGRGLMLHTFAHLSEKIVGLTGTLFGGVASSIYFLEFAFNPRVRETYPWDRDGKGKALWAKSMGALEKVIEHHPAFDEHGVYTGTNSFTGAIREAPACSPRLVQEVLDHAVFVKMTDLGKSMPTLDEIPMAVDMSPPMREAYHRAKREMGKYLFDQRRLGDASFLSKYLQVLLAWPNAPFRAETVIHDWRPNRRDRTQVISTHVTDLPGLTSPEPFPKEQKLIELVTQELAAGRPVGIFLRQTGSRDIQAHYEALIQRHVPLAKTFILRGSVDSQRRERVVRDQIVRKGTNVLIANPQLIEVGVDLVELKTLIFVEVLHSLYPMQQASRRHWRLHQTAACKTYYLFYRNSLEERAVQQLGRKKLAANLLYGDLPEEEGLEALSGEEGLGSLLRELALSLEEADETPVADLTDLFQQTTRPPTTQDSVWLNGIAETIPIEVPTPITIIPSPSPVLPIPAAALTVTPTPARHVALLPTLAASTPTALSTQLATLNLPTAKLAKVQARVMLALEQGIPNPTDSALKLCEGVGHPDFTKHPVHAEVLTRWLAKYLRSEKALHADETPTFAAELIALARPTLIAAPPPLKLTPSKVVPKPKKAKPDLLAVPDNTRAQPTPPPAPKSPAKPQHPAKATAKAVPQQLMLFDLPPVVYA